MQKIGVLTSGGDAPGMNPCVRAVVRTAIFNDAEVVGIHEGFDGLLRGDMAPLRARDVGGILQQGGTILQTARCPEFFERKGQLKGLRELNEAGIEGLIVIGGDGSMSGAYTLQEMEFPVVGIPASIDNDIWGTNISLGVDTALNTIMQAVDKLRDTASSHQRAFLVETMGRDCGYLALMAGIICGAELILIPETEVELEEIGSAVESAYARGKTHCIIISAEGSSLDTHDVAEYLDTLEVGFHTRVTILGHVQRGGSPSAFDRLLATRMGVRAVEALLAGESGIMVGLMGREIQPTDLQEVIERSREANTNYYDMAHMLSR
ncbi:MAG: 6-phosphofructokinase [Anaerolineales bacterium]|nr:6-phosphofructokinase [Anaerolineales bacterium]